MRGALETIDEQLGDLPTISILGVRPPIDSPVRLFHFDFSPGQFVAAIRGMYGTEEDVQNPQIPGADGLVTIPLDQLRNLEEDLEIVHTRILAEEAHKPSPHTILPNT